MTIMVTDVARIEPIGHDEAMLLQDEELRGTLSSLRSLGDADWRLPTECPAWDVLAMYQHVLGACEAGASLRENLHQLRRARAHRKRHGGPLEAALSSVQVEERAALGPVEVIGRLEAVAPRTVRGRTRLPAFVRRHARLAVDGPVHETWRLGYLVDTIYLRDLWMHRIDLHQAIDRPRELTARHDGRIVADIVAEWARRHGKPFELELLGPAGGLYADHPQAPEAERLSLEAIEFCRILAGRGKAVGLLTTVVPF